LVFNGSGIPAITHIPRLGLNGKFTTQTINLLII
jgi:hypothetical protein